MLRLSTEPVPISATPFPAAGMAAPRKPNRAVASPKSCPPVAALSVLLVKLAE